MKIRNLSTGLLVVALTLCAPVQLRAADDPKPTPAAARPHAEITRLKSIIDELKLTGDTKTKVEAVLTKAQSDIEDAIKDDRATAAKHAQQIVASTTEQIQAILDEDQKLMFRSKLETTARASSDAPGRPGAPDRPGAPGAGRGPAQMGQRLKEATATLGLSDEQSQKIDVVIADLQKKAEALRGAGRGPEMREKVMALREDGLKQIKAILTEEQFKKFEEAMRQAPGGGAAGGRLAALIEHFQDALKDLNLTEEQKPKVQAAFANTRKKLAELAPTLQGGQASPEIREKFRAVMDELRTQLTDVLTPEQKEKFHDAMQQGAGAGAGAKPRPSATAKEKPAHK
jgi:Spy/CpxP family protein refolding chaperone